MLGVTLILARGTLWATGRHFRKSDELRVVVPPLGVTSVEVRSFAIGKKAPPIEESLEGFIGSSTVADTSINGDSLISFCAKRCVLLFSARVGRLNAIWNSLARTNDRIVELAHIFIGNGRVSVIGWFRRIERFSSRRDVENVGRTNTEILNRDIEIKMVNEVDRYGRANVGVGMRNSDRNIGDKQKWPPYMQRRFSGLMQIPCDTDKKTSKNCENCSCDSGYERKKPLSRNAADPFPNISQPARVLIAITSTLFGAVLAAWGGFSGWGLVGLRRRGAWFGVCLCFLGGIISLLGQALAWP